MHTCNIRRGGGSWGEKDDRRSRVRRNFVACVYRVFLAEREDQRSGRTKDRRKYNLEKDGCVCEVETDEFRLRQTANKTENLRPPVSLHAGLPPIMMMRQEVAVVVYCK